MLARQDKQISQTTPDFPGLLTKLRDSHVCLPQRNKVTSCMDLTGYPMQSLAGHLRMGPITPLSPNLIFTTNSTSHSRSSLQRTSQWHQASLSRVMIVRHNAKSTSKSNECSLTGRRQPHRPRFLPKSNFHTNTPEKYQTIQSLSQPSSFPQSCS